LLHYSLPNIISVPLLDKDNAAFNCLIQNNFFLKEGEQNAKIEILVITPTAYLGDGFGGLWRCWR
jgi:hypothetical protein